jgi:pimeloyl-ACP methyl ester carboxylesterase
MRLAHGRVSIELQERSGGEGPPLLLLHGLGENADSWAAEALVWPHGPVFALDFSGHGRSDRVRGGAYYPEFFLADADVALEKIGEPCALVGAGVGAYVAFLLAGARCDQVLDALLLDGPGLAGGGSIPVHEMEVPREPEDIEAFERFIEKAASGYATSTDPWVARCERDLRPLDYVTSFARAANPMLFSSRVGRSIPEPDWWRCAFEQNAGLAAPEDLTEALRALALRVGASATRG